MTGTAMTRQAAAPRPASEHILATSAQFSAALGQVLSLVAATGYRFTTPTPLTHQRFLNRRQDRLHTLVGTTLRDIFGWNLPFEPAALDAPLLLALQSAGMLQASGNLLRSGVRIATLGDDFFLHTAYPTTQDNAVFFGPDTYRFARFIDRCVPHLLACKPLADDLAAPQALRLLDVGCGSGAGALALVRALTPPAADRLLQRAAPLAVTMSDINPLALEIASINAAFAGVPVELAQGDVMAALPGEFDVIICNPPYMSDAEARAYRHGGARLGRALSVRIAAEALSRLAPGGHLLLYTGVAIVDGIDPLLAELQPLLLAAGCDWTYSEIDPDVFGEELESAAYTQADRIAAVGLHARRLPEASQ